MLDLFCCFFFKQKAGNEVRPSFVGSDDNSLNPYEVIFGYKEYNKKGDDGCFFYGSAGNSRSGCTDVFDDGKSVHNPN